MCAFVSLSLSFHLSILFVYLSIHPSIYLSIYLCAYKQSLTAVPESAGGLWDDIQHSFKTLDFQMNAELDKIFPKKEEDKELEDELMR